LGLMVNSCFMVDSIRFEKSQSLTTDAVMTPAA
jgi:hypothetical protein